MDLRFTSEELAFGDEVRAFFQTALPESIRDKLVANKGLAKDDIVTWQRILNAKGWAVAHWPVEWGGTGWTPVQQYMFQEELQLTPAPQPLGFGVTMVGPVIIAFGSEAQKKRFLPAIANLDVWWCQGFSEPGAGSDLASLRTAAKRDGDYYIVNGQKTWTTLAQHADWIFCLVRTDPQAKKQEGISFLLIDMQTPGISVRPIVTIDGGREVNEVFFDDVKVPAENLVGEANKGWDYAKYLLGRERTGIARADRAYLLQHPQGLDLRRYQRNPEKHHRQGDPRAVTTKLVMAGLVPAIHVSLCLSRVGIGHVGGPIKSGHDD